MKPTEPTPQGRVLSVPFAPTQSREAVRVPEPLPPPPPRQFTLVVPVAILLVTLNFAAFRNIIELNKRLTLLESQNAPAREMLKNSGKQSEFLKSVRADVLKLAETDPVAAQIAKIYFPPAKGQVEPTPAR